VHVLVIYGTTEGQTAKVAFAISDVFRAAGHEPDVVNATHEPPLALTRYDAILVGASVHDDAHQPHVVEWVRTHRRQLDGCPSAFFQISLTSAIRDLAHQAKARVLAERLTEATGWKPAELGLFAGALRTSELGWWKRFMSRSIARAAGVVGDGEYTRWDEVHAWADRLERAWSMVPCSAARQPAS
jgi:menaquinone-dependent protoporphyrinogen oxidase